MSQYEGRKTAQGVGPPRDPDDTSQCCAGSRHPGITMRSHAHFTPQALRFEKIPYDILQQVFATYLPACTGEILPYLCDNLTSSTQNPHYLDPRLLQDYTRGAAAFALQERIEHNPTVPAHRVATPAHTSTFRLRSLEDNREWMPILSLSNSDNLCLEVEYPRDAHDSWRNVEDLCGMLGQPSAKSAFERASLATNTRDSGQIEVSINSSLSIRAQSNQPAPRESVAGAWRVSEIFVLNAQLLALWDTLGALTPLSRHAFFQSGLIPAALRFIEKPTCTKADASSWTPDVSTAAESSRGIVVATERKILITGKNHGVYPKLNDDSSLLTPLVRSHVLLSPTSPDDALQTLVVQPGGLRSPEESPLFTFTPREREGASAPVLRAAGVADWAAQSSFRLVLTDPSKNSNAAAPNIAWDSLRTLTSVLTPSFALPPYEDFIAALSGQNFYSYPRTVRFVVPADASETRIAFTMRR